SQNVAVTTPVPACSPKSRHMALRRQPGRGPPGNERQVEEALDASRSRAGRRDSIHAMRRGGNNTRVAPQTRFYAFWLPAFDRDKGVGVSAELDLVACSRGT